tara:strand:+ start:204 stop:428 length:225 start_codon:yes stop_codon:yes gene_type:complete
MKKVKVDEESLILLLRNFSLYSAGLDFSPPEEENEVHVDRVTYSISSKFFIPTKFFFPVHTKSTASLKYPTQYQ